MVEAVAVLVQWAELQLEVVAAEQVGDRVPCRACDFSLVFEIIEPVDGKVAPSR